MKRAHLVLPLAISLLAGCPTTSPTRPAVLKAPSPKATKTATVAAVSPAASARPTLPPVSFPPVLVPSPPPSPQSGTVSTIAGTPKVNGLADGAGADAKFNTPSGLAIGPDGNLYVGDAENHRVRKIDLHDPTFPVTTVAGGGVKPAKGGVTSGPALDVYLRKPQGLAFLPDGRLLVPDEEEHAVKVITFAAAGATCELYAGAGDDGTTDGPAAAATFGEPTNVAVGPDGTAYVTDFRYNRIRSISPDGQVKTLAGSGEARDVKKDGPYDTDGAAEKAVFNGPHGLAVAADGTVYVADSANNLIRRIRAGVVTTLAGNGEGYADGFWRAAEFCAPFDVALDGHGDLVVADGVNHRIRRVTPLGDVVTLAGSGPSNDAKTPGDLVDGPATSARFNFPFATAVAPDGTIYVADQRNHCIRKIAP